MSRAHKGKRCPWPALLPAPRPRPAGRAGGTPPFTSHTYTQAPSSPSGQQGGGIIPPSSEALGLCVTGVGTVRTFPIETDIPNPPNPLHSCPRGLQPPVDQSVNSCIPVSPQRGREGTGERSREEDPAPTLTAPTPFPPDSFSPLSPHHTQQEDVLAGNPLIEVDVAQVLGGLLRSTDFLVVVDHPPATGISAAQECHSWLRHNSIALACSQPHPPKTSEETGQAGDLNQYLSSLTLWKSLPAIFLDVTNIMSTHS